MRFVKSLLAVVIGCSAPAPWAETVTFDKDGKAVVDCICVIGGPGCNSKLLDAVSDEQRHKWTQDIPTLSGMKLDLNEVCWRKRDVDPQRECCVTNDDADTIKRLFSGRIQ